MVDGLIIHYLQKMIVKASFSEPSHIQTVTFNIWKSEPYETVLFPQSKSPTTGSVAFIDLRKTARHSAEIPDYLSLILKMGSSR